MQQAESMKSQAFDFDVNDLAPSEIQDFIWRLFQWRDSVFKDVLRTISFIPGLASLFETLAETLNACKRFLIILNKHFSDVLLVIYSLLDPILQVFNIRNVKSLLNSGASRFYKILSHTFNNTAKKPSIITSNLQ